MIKILYRFSSEFENSNLVFILIVNLFKDYSFSFFSAYKLNLMIINLQFVEIACELIKFKMH